MRLRAGRGGKLFLGRRQWKAVSGNCIEASHRLTHNQLLGLGLHEPGSIPDRLYLLHRTALLTTHLQLVPRSRKCGSINPLHHTSSWRSAQLIKYKDFTFYIIFYYVTIARMSRSSAVGIVADYRLDDRGLGSLESRIFASPYRPDLLWRPPNIDSGYRGSFPGSKAAGA
jgi:hypothetical protein